MIRHIVALNFLSGTPETTKMGLYGDLSGLSGQIDGILDFQARSNISPEDALVRGFRDLFWFDFVDESVRDAYLENDAHKAIGARLVSHMTDGADGIFVMDFEV